MIQPIWLASYPKSGNTWLRMMLQAYLHPEEALDINNISVGSAVLGRFLFDEWIGIPASDLTDEEVLRWRGAALRSALNAGEIGPFLKTHDARVAVADDVWTIPPDLPGRAVYLVRDPRDVAVSLARHLACTLDQAIDTMAETESPRRRETANIASLVPQYWSSWSVNVDSWAAGEGAFPACVVRYEDMRGDPGRSLKLILEALGYEIWPERIDHAVVVTELGVLRRQEEECGFVERFRSDQFFGAGQVGGWRGRLTAGHVARLERDHGPVMTRLGYLD